MKRRQGMQENWKENVLKELGIVFMELGFTTQLLGKNEDGMDTLRTVLMPREEKVPPMIMDLGFYGVDYAPILQFYVYISNGMFAKNDAGLEKEAEMEKLEHFKKAEEAVKAANSFAPLGHFGFYGEEKQLYYRYCMVLDAEADVHQAARSCLGAFEQIFVILNGSTGKML